ncbi:MAG: M42 family metallopeptidase [Candidatus Omnitrophica bacterium]|nr:M42 family metallopeptidase [Candidatus Omnitrophota bacterium]MDD5429667.1 M42 family metallopeptidase [Candidatus Omnitrophota bacterium]
MEKESLEFLKKLINTASPSGSEEEAGIIWREEVAKSISKVKNDIHGNSIAVINEAKTPKVMLAAHIDEIGFMVKYIDKEGFIYFSAVGGIDARLVSGQRVKIKTKKGNVLGVVGKKPIHLLKPEEKKKAEEITDLWIDIGAENQAQAKAKVDIGDVAVIDVGFDSLCSDRIVGRGLDDKAGVFVAAEVLKSIFKESFDTCLVGVATVQEEIGLRGAKTSAYGISPDIGIAVDVTFASDFPTMDKKETGDIKIGAGPVIAKGPNINSKIFDLLVNTAKEKNIPYQIEAISRATGTDANVIQLTKSGVATGLVSIPLRYMHTPVEIVSLKDLENTIALIKQFILKVDKNLLV